MEKSLSAFLAQNKAKSENVKFVATKNFIDKETGKPLEWEIKAISAAQDEAIRKSCTVWEGKKGQKSMRTDTDKYLGKFAVACTVFPDLNDVKLQDSYGVKSAESLLRLMLLSGEYTRYIEKLQEIGGYVTDMEELVEEAKN